MLSQANERLSIRVSPQQKILTAEAGVDFNLPPEFVV